jgi:hypothetical protein
MRASQFKAHRAARASHQTFFVEPKRARLCRETRARMRDAIVFFLSQMCGRIARIDAIARSFCELQTRVRRSIAKSARK